MKTLSAVIVLAAVLVLPAGAVAKPDASDKRAAIAQCKSERGKSKATRRAFKAKYHSFSRCIRQNAAEEHAEKKAARKNAAKECKCVSSKVGGGAHYVDPMDDEGGDDHGQGHKKHDQPDDD
jgi:hypothetical protein